MATQMVDLTMDDDRSDADADAPMKMDNIKTIVSLNPTFNAAQQTHKFRLHSALCKNNSRGSEKHSTNLTHSIGYEKPGSVPCVMTCPCDDGDADRDPCFQVNPKTECAITRSSPRRRVGTLGAATHGRKALSYYVGDAGLSLRDQQNWMDCDIDQQHKTCTT